YEPVDKPLGKWERKAGKTTWTLLFEDGRLHVSASGADSVVVHADYSVTRDGVVYGVITSVESDEDVSRWEEVHDQPFSFRFRIEEGALIVGHFRGEKNEHELEGRSRLVQPATPRPTACYGPGQAPPPPPPSDPPLQSYSNKVRYR